jgi:hypothetical protein
VQYLLPDERRSAEENPMKLTIKSHLITATLVSLTGLLQIACGGGSDGGGSSSDPSGDGDEGSNDLDDGDSTDDDEIVDTDDLKDDTMDPIDSMGGAGSEPDYKMAAPGVISSNVEDGDVGVLPDTAFTVEFSEPMDRKSVEDAYESESLPAEAVDFSWNDDWTILTITPKEDLNFTWDWDINFLGAAQKYDFTIHKTAVSNAGETLRDGCIVGIRAGRR